MNTEEILHRYIDAKINSVTPLGDGHINETLLADTDKGKFVLQCLQKGMDTARLEHNYRLYSRECDCIGWYYPAWLSNGEGNYFYTDQSGRSWRVYRYIDGDILSAPLSRENLYACGQGLARMHSVLNFYYDEYRQTLISPDLCSENRDSRTEEQINAGIERFLTLKPAAAAVVHGDAKLANILFRNGSVTGFLDYDTVMCGDAAEDIADCIRSCCVSSGRPDRASADLLLDGYVSQAGDDIIRAVPAAFDKICFELALRYYTDHLSQKKRFREKYPGYCLERAQSLISLRWGG